MQKTCATCPDRDNCVDLCPDVLPYYKQDEEKTYAKQFNDRETALILGTESDPKKDY